MGSSAAQPIDCYECKAVPEFNTQGVAIGGWEYRTRIEGHQIIYYTLCPVCAKTK